MKTKKVLPLISLLEEFFKAAFIHRKTEPMNCVFLCKFIGSVYCLPGFFVMCLFRSAGRSLLSLMAGGTLLEVLHPHFTFSGK